MPSLGDAYDGASDAWALRRLYLASALLFVGAVVAAPGLVRVTAGTLEAVGVAEGTAFPVAVAAAGLAVPVVGAGLLRWVPSSPQLRAVGAAGILLSTVAIAAFLSVGPSGSVAGLSALPAIIPVTYVAGAMLALWSPIVAAGLAAEEGGEQPAVASTFVRSRTAVRPAGRVPADGGEDEEQLAFLLDQDER